MKKAIEDIIRNSAIQLFIAYAVLAVLSLLGIISGLVVHFEIFAVILGIMAALSIHEKGNMRVGRYWIFVAVAVIIIMRILPYINNSVPLGYDPGIYKYIIDNPAAHDLWVRAGFEPALFAILSFFKLLGFSTNAILTYVLIFFEVVLGLAIFLVARKFFSEKAGILSVLLYSVSVVQFKAFGFGYYKQIVGLIFLLASVYLLKLWDEKKSAKTFMLLAASASILGGLHRPTFLLFGLLFIAYTAKSAFRGRNINFKNARINILLGACILAIAVLIYAGRIREAVLDLIVPVFTAGIGSGTFVDAASYNFLSLAYLPFALLGFFFLIRKKNFNMVFLWIAINGAIVYFRLVFFNRFIISLDIAMIISAAYGMCLLLQYKKTGAVVVALLLASSACVVFFESVNSRPMVSAEELGIIASLDNLTAPGAFVMSTDAYYSPWLLGYSGRRVIAPGLFDYDNWTREEWDLFWSGPGLNETRALFGRYGQKVYVFVGEKRPMANETFNNECFEKIFDNKKTFIYKWVC